MDDSGSPFAYGSLPDTECVMWRIWLLIDLKLAVVGGAVALFTLALIIHFVLLSTERYNWIGGSENGAQSTLVPAMEPALDRQFDLARVASC